MSSEAAVQVQFGAAIGGLVAGVNEVKEQIEGLAEFTQGITQTFAEVGEALVAAFAIEQIESFVEHLTDLGLQVERTAQQIGMSAEQVGVLNYAASLSDVSLEELRHGMERFALGVQEAAKGTGNQAAAFSALGISVRDASGNIRPMDELLGDVMDRFSQTADNGNKTALAMALFGRQGADLIPVLDQGRSGLAELKQAAEDTGTVMSGQMVESLTTTKQALTTMNLAFEGIELSVFSTFKPAIDGCITGLTSLAEAFVASAKDGGAVQYALEALEVGFNALVTDVIAVTEMFNALWSTARSVFSSIATIAVESATALYDAMHGNIAKADSDVQLMGDRIGAVWKANADNAVKDWQDATARIDKLWSGLLDKTPTQPSGEASKSKQSLPGLGDSLGKGDSDQMQQWQSQLDRMLMADQIFGDKAKQVEEQYWESKLATADKGSKEYDQLVGKVYSYQNQAYQQDVQANLAAYNEKEEAAKGDFAKVQQIEQQKLAYMLQVYGQDSRQYQAELKRQEQMDDQHVKETEQKYQQMFQSMFHSFDAAIKGMIQGTETFHQAVTSVFEGMLTSLVDVLEKMAAKWLAEQIVGETTTATTASADIKASAAQAGAAAYAATAAIPLIGPELAPAAGDLAYAGALAYEGLASFDVGAWSINADQIAQVHQGEMIVPARPAQQWRDSLEGGMGGGGSTSITINAVDARSVASLIRANPDAVAAGLAQAARMSSRNINAPA